MVSIQAFYSEDSSSNPADIVIIILCIVLQKDEKTKKDQGRLSKLHHNYETSRFNIFSKSCNKVATEYERQLSKVLRAFEIFVYEKDAYGFYEVII